MGDGSAAQTISLPKGGGALQGIGEKFSPDLHTGTANFSVPLEIPPGRNGLQPQLTLGYSTGSGNGSFGLGWSLGVPSVARKTSKGLPRYRDDSPLEVERDVFILSGAEDLVPVEISIGATRYRPRTEGLFARIIHHHDADQANDYWEVRSKDGLVNLYGTQGAAGNDAATIANPQDRTKVLAWKLTETADPFGNRIEYDYLRDTGSNSFHEWDQLYLEEIRYADFLDTDTTKFLVTVTFVYEDDRPDPFSEYRAGFEIRTRKRCKQIRIYTHADQERLVRTYDLVYLDERAELETQRPLNGVSLLSQIQVTGYDGAATETLPPLEFGYTRFEPEARRMLPISGPELPPYSLANPDYELTDLFGNGLPDVLEMNGTVRYWRNLGGGCFDRPREMRSAPSGLGLADPGVQLLDANGDGRADLLVNRDNLSGYFPLRFEGEWDRHSFTSYRVAPSFPLKDPEVHLVDLNGDGVTDAMRSGTRLECFFNDPTQGWTITRFVERQRLPAFPDVNFSDPRIKWADMTGDGLQDIVLIHEGNVQYWPNLGYGNWGKCVSMQNSPTLPLDYDPQRILITDADGDGAADMVYVDNQRVTLWINQSGNAWSHPIPIHGTPAVTNLDTVRPADVLGTGVSGVLWSAEAGRWARSNMFFLDFTGGVKPYLLNEMNNHLGAVTHVGYAPSTTFYLEDYKHPETRWKTPLPFPVQVVKKVEVIDQISLGKLTTEYFYHHGYWDGAEREFHGFGMVEQRDTETFDQYNQPGLHGDAVFNSVEMGQFSPPTLTKTWFHQGAIGDEFGDWCETNFAPEFWSEDPPALARPEAVTAFLNALPRRVKRDALRTLRGHTLRTELYALDGAIQQMDGTLLENRPYTVTEQVYGVSQPEKDQPIFFQYLIAQRTTQWERGSEPMTTLAFSDGYDAHGQPRQQTKIAVPRGRNYRVDAPANEPYLVTTTVTDYAQRDDTQCYIVDRVARTTSYEICNDGSDCVDALHESILNGEAQRQIIGQSLNFYDGAAFVGLPYGQLGSYGAPVRTENLVLTPEILHEAYKSGTAVQNPPEEPPYLRTNRVNVALESNGATATASSTFEQDNPPSTVINGERKAAVWPGYWADNTRNAYPDWIEVRFSGTKTINEIDVLTTQDAPLDGTGPAVEPTLDLTFSRYGITAFEVQYWTGSDWATVPGGSVTGNNKVWRKFTFSNLTTGKIRVVVNNAAGGVSRIVEIEAYESGTGRNVALAANGGTAVASSIVQPWPPRLAINGDRIVYHWKSHRPFESPQWLQVNFARTQSIEEIDVYFHQDVSKPFVPPTEELTSPYAITDLDVQYWNGTDWVNVSEGSVRGNNRVWRQFRFAKITTNKIRVFVLDSPPGGAAAIMELEAYTADPGWSTGDYPPEFQASLPTLQGASDARPGLQLTSVGYGFATGAVPFSQGYFIATTRRRYDWQLDPQGKGRGLVVTQRDPLDRDTSIIYDPYALLPTTVENPTGLVTSAVYDYRVLQTRESTDSNGNRTAYSFSPLGLLQGTAVMGKVGERVGDTPAVPGTRLFYDFRAFFERGLPISVRTVQRIHHVNDNPTSDETLERVEYSDGFGRELQKRSHADDVYFGDPTFGDSGLPPRQVPGLVPGAVGQQVNADEPPRVVVSGWQIFDNKGRVIQSYEPFLASGWDYAPPGDREFGQAIRMEYDPRGHLVRTINPNGSEQRVVHGFPPDLTQPELFTPTPWEAYTYDTNDNAGHTHPTDSASYQHHWNTPSSVVVDALGRTVTSVARNRNSTGQIEEYRTCSTYDIRGNLLTVTDELDRPAFCYVYDLANHVLRTEQPDAGVRRMIPDAAGNPLEKRDSKGALLLYAYDVLNRAVLHWARDASGETLTLRERLVYGDNLDRTQAQMANLLGKLYQHYDEAGLQTVSAYDFKGNALDNTWRVIRDEQILNVFEAGPANRWQVEAYRVDWQPPAGTSFDDYANGLLDPTPYETSLHYDALNRVTLMRYPQAVDGAHREITPTYNRAGLLAKVAMDGTPYVERLAYNPKGQRLLVAYGNGLMTRYAYNPQTFRLVRLRSERYTTAREAPLTYTPSDPTHPLQDLGYEYDLAGNILAIHDRAPSSGLPGKLDQLDRTFSYDALYRLLAAKGRECDMPPATPWDTAPRCADVTRARAYAESYDYDRAGNVTRFGHASDTGSFTRTLTLAPQSNRLATVTIGDVVYSYHYDANGNLTDENTTRHFEWDHRDHLRVYRTQVEGSEPSMHAHYLYDASGQRVKKLVRKQGGQYAVTVYIRGIFEYQRTVQGTTTRENNIMHVMDNQSRIASVRVGDPISDDATPAVKYQLSDHLSSSNVVVDDSGGWINREEYTPYGETSFGSYARKRYRFSGKERDEESGLYYHGARFYAPWLARWVTCDPAGRVDGLNVFAYVSNNPLRFTDARGLNKNDKIVVNQAKPPEALAASSKEGGPETTHSENKVLNNALIKQGIQILADLLSKAGANADKTTVLWKGERVKELARELAIKSKGMYRSLEFSRIGQAAEKIEELILAVAPKAERAKEILDRTLWKAASALHGFKGGISGEKLLTLISADLQSGETLAQLGRGNILRNIEVPAYRLGQKLMPVAQKLGRALPIIGGLISGAGLAHDIQKGDVSSGVGNALGVLEAGAATIGAGTAAAVIGAGAAGYAVGTVLNEHLVQPLIDKAAPGSGSLGDWYYRTFLK